MVGDGSYIKPKVLEWGDRACPKKALPNLVKWGDERRPPPSVAMRGEQGAAGGVHVLDADKVIYQHKAIRWTDANTSKPVGNHGQLIYRSDAMAWMGACHRISPSLCVPQVYYVIPQLLDPCIYSNLS